MTAETTATEKTQQKQKVIYRGATEAVYGLGLIGAAVFYIGQAPTFWLGVLGFLKAIVWPALLVYEALKYFG
jgi:TM2 domain-containing membrane protein YozV